MQHPIHPTPIREETALDLGRSAPVRSPLMWVVVWVLRAAICAQVMSSILWRRAAPQQTAVDVPKLFHRNRQLRRARESCLRRAKRHALMGKQIKPENYAPRAYAHFAYVNMMDKTRSPGQFMEAYIRDNDLSRVQVYGMDSAHAISGFVPADLAAGFSEMCRALFSGSARSLAVLSDPAPP